MTILSELENLSMMEYMCVLEVFSRERRYEFLRQRHFKSLDNSVENKS